MKWTQDKIRNKINYFKQERTKKEVSLLNL